MGKFVRLCSNALHDTWCKGYARNIDLTVPTKRYLQVFKNVAKQNGLKPHKVRFMCKRCIEKARMKRDFTRSLGSNDAPISTTVEVLSFSPLLSFVG